MYLGIGHPGFAYNYGAPSMSIEFNWEKLTDDSAAIEQHVCDFLNQQFQSIQLPNFISSLSVQSFKLGSSPPEIVLKHFSDPFPEFYEISAEIDEQEREEESGSEANESFGKITPEQSPELSAEVSEASDGEPNNTAIRHSTPNDENGDIEDDSSVNYHLEDESSEAESTNDTHKSPFDMQSYIELKYDGDMQLSVSATLLVNYPAPSFISLPVFIKVSQINIHALLVAASIKNRVYLTVMSDVHNRDVVPAEEVDVIKSMKIESEIGDNSDHGALLRNVGKAEKFVIEQLRNVIRDELVWPGWLTLEV